MNQFVLCEYVKIALYEYKGNANGPEGNQLDKPKSNLYKTFILDGNNTAGFSITIQ